MPKLMKNIGKSKQERRNSTKIGSKLGRTIEKPEINGELWPVMVPQVIVHVTMQRRFAAQRPHTTTKATSSETPHVLTRVLLETGQSGSMRATVTENGSTVNVAKCREMKAELASLEKELRRKNGKLNLTLFTLNISELRLEQLVPELTSLVASCAMPNTRRTTGDARRDA